MEQQTIRAWFVSWNCSFALIAGFAIAAGVFCSSVSIRLPEDTKRKQIEIAAYLLWSFVFAIQIMVLKDRLVIAVYRTDPIKRVGEMMPTISSFEANTAPMKTEQIPLESIQMVFKDCYSNCFYSCLPACLLYHHLLSDGTFFGIPPLSKEFRRFLSNSGVINGIPVQHHADKNRANKVFKVRIIK